ncbi:hypothetical protein [Jeotgalibacillus malaysiensis]|uniref:hypothetical protein n=1 Tax=Jeotgalibacillus malaysiensis TaxID=1508404 RepID=UPI00384BF47A
MIESILSLSICMSFCLFIIPVVVLLNVKADEAEERYRMYEVAYEQVKLIHSNHHVQTHSYKDGREYTIEINTSALCIRNHEEKEVCINQ